MVGPRLRRLELAAGSGGCELQERGTAFLWQLRGLTSLDLESCLSECCKCCADFFLFCGAAFLWQLRALTSLDLESCLGGWVGGWVAGSLGGVVGWVSCACLRLPCSQSALLPSCDGARWLSAASNPASAAAPIAQPTRTLAASSSFPPHRLLTAHRQPAS